MAGQVRLYTRNNFERNFRPLEYPDQIVLRGRDLDYFSRISPLIDTMDELNGRADELVLERDLFSVPWGLILDLLFPYELPEPHPTDKELFKFTVDGLPYLNPFRADATMSNLREIIDYFLIGHPRDMNEILLRFAYMRPGAPARPHNAHFTVTPGEALREERELRRAYRNAGPENNFAPGNNEWNWPNNNNNENEGPEIGYTEEEEEVLGRLQGANAARYFRGGKTRRAKKLKRKTRKH